MREFFSQFGKVVDSTVMLDRETGRSKGFGFVSFEDTDVTPFLGFGNLEIDGKMVSGLLFFFVAGNAVVFAKRWIADFDLLLWRRRRSMSNWHSHAPSVIISKRTEGAAVRAQTLAVAAAAADIAPRAAEWG